MIDLDSEHLLSVSEASAVLPGRPHFATLWRWAQRGIRGVRLEIIKIVGRTYTSREALQRFADAVTAARGVESTLTKGRAAIIVGP